MKRIIRIYILLVLFLILFTTVVFANNSLQGFTYITKNGYDDFFIGTYEVTNAEYKKYLDSTPNAKAPKYWTNGMYPIGKEYHPVVYVSYDDAMRYCEHLNNINPNYNFRLPTSEEWMYAARGNTNNLFPWGNDNDKNRFNCNYNVSTYYLQQNPIVTYVNEKSSEYGKSKYLNEIISISNNGGVKGFANHNDYTGFIYTDLFKTLNDNGGFTTPVNQYPTGISPFGVYDMSGNVWEWTSTKIIATNGAEKGQEVNEVLGGSWYSNVNSCKIDMQGEGRKPNMAYNTIGFRVVAANK